MIEYINSNLHNPVVFPFFTPQIPMNNQNITIH